jgi:hypothetical protein
MSNNVFLHRHTKTYRDVSPYPLVNEPGPLDEWVQGVNRQRLAYPDQPYLTPLLPIDTRSTLSLYGISTLISVGGYSYSGVKEIEYPLYRDRYIITSTGLWDDHTLVGDNLSVGDMDDDYKVRTERPSTGLHWEFVKEGAAPMQERQYLYLPVGQYTDSVMQLVPQIPYWVLHNSSNGHLLPDRQYLLPSKHTDYGEWYNIGPIGMGTSPFLPGLVSTGVTTVIGDGEILYEYQDVQGTYSPLGTLYMSPLRPTNHHYPLGRPKPGDLVFDVCVPIGGMLEKGTTPWVGYSTGYRTSNSYHPFRTYYLYEDAGGGTFLDDAVPSMNVWPLIEDLLGDGGITIHLECVRDELYIRDVSCGVVVELPDLPSYGYRDGDVWGDCVVIGDGYYLAWDPCNAYWGDRIWVDDYLMIDPCAVIPSNCEPLCWWSDEYHVNNTLVCEE